MYLDAIKQKICHKDKLSCQDQRLHLVSQYIYFPLVPSCLCSTEIKKISNLYKHVSYERGMSFLSGCGLARPLETKLTRIL